MSNITVEKQYILIYINDCPPLILYLEKKRIFIENMVTTFKILNQIPQFFQDMTEQMFRNALKVLKD